MKKIAFSIVLISAVFAASAQAAQVAVLPVQGTNLTAPEELAIGQLMAQAYAAQSGLNVLEPKALLETDRGGPASQPAGRDPLEMARKQGIFEYITTSAVRLGSKLTIHCTRYHVTGSFIYQAWLTAASLDDLEQVAARLAGALYQRRPVEETRTLTTITATESRPPNRLFAEKVWGVKSLTSFIVAAGASFTPTTSFGFDGRLEGERFFLEFGAGFTIPTSFNNDAEKMGGISMEIGASYYLLQGNISPYVGTGIAPRIFFGDEGGGGMVGLWGQLGLMLFRMSSTRLYADFRVTQNVVPLSVDDHQPGGDVITSKDLYPTEFGLALGIGW